MKTFLMFIVSLMIFLPQIVAASTSTYAQDTTLAVGVYSYTIISGSTASSVVVNDNSTVTVTTDADDIFSIKSADRYRLISNTSVSFTCGTAYSLLTVTGSKTVTITPSSAVCTTQDNAGGGGSSSSTSSTPVPTTSFTQIVAPTATTKPVVPKKSGKEPKVDMQGLAFDDVPGSGAAAVTEANSNTIYKIAKLMDESGAFVFKGVKDFYPANMTLRNFALQMALAAAGENCGNGAAYKECKKSARELGLFVTQSEFYEPNREITRVQFYEILINALKLPHVISAGAKRYSCDDVPQDSDEAKIMATARKHRIASVYSGNNCWPDKVFNRTSAAIFTARALEAKARLEAQN